MSNPILTTLEWLLDIPSVTGKEDVLTEALLARLQPHGDHTLIRWRNGLLLTPIKHEPSLLLVGHLDTVPPTPGQARHQSTDKVYGCGSSDMKAGVAVMLTMLEQHPQDPIAYLFYDREEGPLKDNGLTPLLDHLKTPGIPAIVLEPTLNEVQVGCVGSLHLAITFNGVRAHAARPWQGRNALYEALPLLNHLAHRLADDIIVSGQTFRQVITPTVLTTPTLTNAVPSEARLNVNIRFAPGQDPETLIAECRHYAGPQATIKLLDLAPAGKVSHQHPRFHSWITQRQLTVAPKQAWTDVAQLTASGYPALNFGPGDPSQAHQANEWAPIAELKACYDHLRALLEIT